MQRKYGLERLGRRAISVVISPAECLQFICRVISSIYYKTTRLLRYYRMFILPQFIRNEAHRNIGSQRASTRDCSAVQGGSTPLGRRNKQTLLPSMLQLLLSDWDHGMRCTAIFPADSVESQNWSMFTWRAVNTSQSISPIMNVQK